MLDTLIGLAPLAAGLVVFGVVVAFLIGRDSALAAWLVAAFLLAHGLVHVMFVVPGPPVAAETAAGVAYPFDLGRSWLVAAGLDVATVRTIGTTLVVAVVAGYGLAALASVDLLVPMSWWPALVLGASIASASVLVVALSPGLALGFAIDAVLALLVLAEVWVPRTRFALGG